MMTKKIIALALALLLIFVLVGCSKNERQIVKLTLSTEDSEAILAAAGITLLPAASPALALLLAAASAEPQVTILLLGHSLRNSMANRSNITLKNSTQCSPKWNN